MTFFELPLAALFCLFVNKVIYSVVDTPRVFSRGFMARLINLYANKVICLLFAFITYLKVFLRRIFCYFIRIIFRKFQKVLDTNGIMWYNRGVEKVKE